MFKFGFYGPDGPEVEPSVARPASAAPTNTAASGKASEGTTGVGTAGAGEETRSSNNTSATADAIARRVSPDQFDAGTST